MFEPTIGSIAVAGLGSLYGGIFILGHAAGKYNEKAKISAAILAAFASALIGTGVQTEVSAIAALKKPALVVKNAGYKAKP